jgi:hypothetical protein
VTGASEALHSLQAPAQQTQATLDGGQAATAPPGTAQATIPAPVPNVPSSTITQTVTQQGAGGFFDVPGAAAPAQAGVPSQVITAPPGAAPAARPSGGFFDVNATTSPPPPPPSSPMDWALPAVGAAALAALAIRYGRAAPAAALRTSITGLNAPAEVATPWHVRQLGYHVDQAAPAAHAVRTVNPSAYTDVRNMINDSQPQATAIRQMHAWSEGWMDGHRLSEIPKTWVDDYTRMTPAQQAATEQLRIMEHEIGNLAAGRAPNLHANPVTNQPWASTNILGGATPGRVIRELTRETAALRSDPIVNQMVNRGQALQQSFNQYAFRQGLINAAELAELQTTRRGFTALIQETAQPNMLKRLLELTSTGQVQRELIDLSTMLKQQGAEVGTKFLPSPQATEQMLRTLMTSAAHNRARIGIIDNVMLAQPGTRYANVITAVPRSGQDTISVLRNGKAMNYQVTDASLRTSMRVVPDHADVIMGVIDRTRQISQATATGVGNPAFPIVSNTWNGMVAALTRPSGTRVGLFQGDVVGGAIEAQIGAARGIGAMAARNMSQTLERSIRTNGFLAQALTPQMTQHLANRLARTWQNSTLHAMQELGATGVGRMSADTHIPNRHTLMDSMNPEYVSRVPSLSKGWAMYRDTLDMIRSGSNIQFFARNRGRVGDVTAARMSAELTGNASVRGSSQLSRGAGKAIPFGNVAVQEFAAMGRAARENPLGFGMGTALGVGLPAIAMVEAGRRLGGPESEDYFDYTFRRMSPEEQARYFVIPIPGMRPEDMPHISIPNSMRVGWAMARDGYAALTGATPEATLERGISNTLRGGALTAQPISTPPIINALLGLVNQQSNIPGRGNSMIGVSPLRGGGAVLGEPDVIQGMPPDATGPQRLMYSTMLNSIVTTLTTVAGQTAMDSARAFEQASRSTGGTGTPWRDAASVITSQPQRQLTMFGVTDIWGQSRRVGTQNQDGIELSRAQDDLQRIQREFNENIPNQGRAGGRRGGMPDANLAQVSGARDLHMGGLMARAADFSRSISQHDLRRLGLLRDQLSGTVASPSYTPREHAERRADINRQIMEQQRETMQRIRSFEEAQSRYYGRRIRLSDITRTGRVSDLPLLPTQ